MRVSSFLLTTMVAVCLVTGAEARRKAALAVQLDRSGIDLEARTVSFRLNRPAESAQLTVYDESGAEIAQHVEVYDSVPARTPLTIGWPELPPEVENFRIDIRFTDVDDFWVDLTICRFHGYVPHEEVIFETGKWDIRPEERRKLDDALPLIIEMIERAAKCDDHGNALYVAGYTDTVGSIAANRELSRRRARSIARYFLANGLAKRKIAVYVRGFGQEVLAVPTGDNVDEERNRRADYIVANFHPDMPGPGAWTRVQ